MVVLRAAFFASLAACYSPEIPDCVRTDSCALAAEIDAGVEPPADARPDARPPDAQMPMPMMVMLDVRVDGRGDVTIPTIGTCSAGNGMMQCMYQVPKGVPLSLTATPKNGWRFERWEDACNSTGPCTITPMMPTSVRARFRLIDD